MSLISRLRALPGHDLALLLVRLVLGVVLFAHGWQKLLIKGIAGTYGWFQAMGIPLAIVSTSFVTVVEFVGGALLLLGALTRVVAGLHIIVMIGAAAFVHVSNGLFAEGGGWELVGVIAACEVALITTGAGRFSVDHLVHLQRRRRARTTPGTAMPSSMSVPSVPGHAERPHGHAALVGQAAAVVGHRGRCGGPVGPADQSGDRGEQLFAKPTSAPATLSPPQPGSHASRPVL